ncbi:hypothetical protein [Priestia megaterium]|uniref:hypothetical protein n=1 Tax=Priestia megaterium TaxID=1404 RepID=UPI002E1B65D4|nr:hypothetical protein [Priestia megaterium]
MKLILKGQIDKDTLIKKIEEVAESTIERVEQETGAKITGHEIHEAEVTVKVLVEGMDEPQVLTVEHHEGQKEMLTWVVDVDEETVLNNEEESLFDEYTVAKAQGKELEFKEVKTKYNLIDLTEDKSLAEEFSDMSKKVYDHKDGFKVVKVFQNKKLVQEYKLVPKEVSE